MNNISIVLGYHGVNAVGLIRSLGEKGNTVIFASPSSRIESKYCHKYIRLPNSQDDWFKILNKIILNLDVKPFIFPTDDASALFIDGHWKDLEEICYFSHLHGEFLQYADKKKMGELAISVGLNVPKTIILSLDKNKLELPCLPVILKPKDGISGDKGDIRICRTTSQINDAIEKFMIKKNYEILCQMFIEGDNVHEVGLMGVSLDNGNVVIPGTINKVRSWPPNRGSTSYAHFVPGVECEDINKLIHFVQSTGYSGIFDIEMMIADGKAWFIEINYRNGQYGYTLTKAGYNLASAWIQGIQTGILPKVEKIEALDYMNEREDFQYVKQGLLPFQYWWKQFHESQAYGMYCPGDQRPFWRQFIKIPDRLKIYLGMKI